MIHFPLLIYLVHFLDTLKTNSIDYAISAAILYIGPTVQMFRTLDTLSHCACRDRIRLLHVSHDDKDTAATICSTFR